MRQLRVRKLDEKWSDLFWQKNVGDHVERTFGRNWRFVLCLQSRRHRYVRGHHVVVQQFSHDQDAVGTLHRMHVDYADRWRIHVLRSPVVSRTAIDHIPAKIIYGNHLRRNRGLPGERPVHVPLITVSHYLQIAGVYCSANYRGPIQLQPDIGLIFRRVERPHVEVIQRRIGAEIGRVSGEIQFKFLLGKLGLIGEAVIGFLPVAGFDFLAQILDCLFGS